MKYRRLFAMFFIVHSWPLKTFNFSSIWKISWLHNNSQTMRPTYGRRVSKNTHSKLLRGNNEAHSILKKKP